MYCQPMLCVRHHSTGLWFDRDTTWDSEHTHSLDNTLDH
jgi:hypothetical protein